MNEEDISKEPVKQSKKTRPWTNIGILFSALAVIVLLALFYVVNFYYMENFAIIRAQQSTATLTRTNVVALEQQVAQLTQDLKTQTDILNALRQTQTGYTRDEWRLVEAEFLTKIANDKLQLENNPAQAIMLLQRADQEIRNLNDAKYLPIRKALAEDITALQAVPQVDTQGIYLRLAALNTQLNQLPLPAKPAVEQTNAVQNEKLHWWQRGLHATWQGLRQIVTVRYNPGDVPALTQPQQREFFYLNLHAAIEKSMWALLHQQPEIYRSSLDQLLNWIKQYCAIDAPLTQSVLKNLTELQAINIHPTLPALHSLTAFQDFFQEQKVENTAAVPAQ